MDEPESYYTEELLDDILTLLKEFILDIDRSARAYGWEIGRGQTLYPVVPTSPENPFREPDWRRTHGVFLKTDTSSNPQGMETVITASDSERHDLFKEGP